MDIEVVSKYFLNILESFTEGVYISDPLGYTIWVNKAYQEITGLKLEELKNINVRTLISKGVFDKALNPEIVRTGRPSTHVQSLADGKKVILSGFPVHDTAGNICLVVTFVHDVTTINELAKEVTKQKTLIEVFHKQLDYFNTQQPLELPIFHSPEMQETMSFLHNCADTDVTVLLLGETGVGKDVLARYIHGLSCRKSKMFVKLDCGSIPENLIESEMFGYASGSFTGASNKGKIGYFEMANGGTLFLDEIGELPLSMQTRLLRVLQDSEMTKVGSVTPIKVDVRIIAATNKNLLECIKEGTFRRDLYYRLNVAKIEIPSLRDRIEDIRPLTDLFLNQYNIKYNKRIQLAENAYEALIKYHWPGNIRELQNLVHSLAISSNSSLITQKHVARYIYADDEQEQCLTIENNIYYQPDNFKKIIHKMEKHFLEHAIEIHGSVDKVAEMFQLNRSTIYRKLKEK